MRTEMKDLIIKVLEFIMAMLMSVMAILVFVNVVLRYAFQSGINGSDEVARLSFVWLSFIGAVVVMITGGHLGVDMFLRKLSVKTRRVIGFVGRLLMGWALLLLVWGSWQQILTNYGIVAMGAIPYPIWWAYAAGLFAGLGGLVWVAIDIRLLYRGDLSCLEFNTAEEDGEIAAVISSTQKLDATLEPETEKHNSKGNGQ